MKSRAQRYRYVRHVVSATRPSPRSPLSLGLAAYWQLGEASGTRADSHTNGENLTDNATVTQADGVGAGQKAAQFTLLNSEYLSHADDDVLDTGDIDFTIAGWVYLDSTPADVMYIASKGLSATPTLEYRLMWDPGAGLFVFDSWAPDLGSRDRANASTYGSAPTATWAYVVAWRDKTAGKVRIQVNNGTVDEANITVIPAAGNGPFNLGRDAYSSANYWDGRLQAFGFWKRVLTAAERTWLYNSGTSARTYADLMAYRG